MAKKPQKKGRKNLDNLEEIRNDMEIHPSGTRARIEGWKSEIERLHEESAYYQNKYNETLNLNEYNKHQAERFKTLYQTEVDKNSKFISVWSIWRNRYKKID